MATVATATPNATVSRRFSVDSFERFRDDDGNLIDSPSEKRSIQFILPPQRSSSLSANSLPHPLGQSTKRVNIAAEDHTSAAVTTPASTIALPPLSQAAVSGRRTVSFAQHRTNLAASNSESRDGENLTRSPSSATPDPVDLPLSATSRGSGVQCSCSPSPSFITTLGNTPVVTPSNAMTSSWAESPGPGSQPFALLARNTADTPQLSTQSEVPSEKEQGLELSLLTPLHHRLQVGGLSEGGKRLIGTAVIPSVHQPTTSNAAESSVNRWLVTGVCLIVAFMTGSFLFNWPAAQSMLLKGGAYSWLCNQDEPSPSTSSFELPLTVNTIKSSRVLRSLSYKAAAEAVAPPSPSSPVIPKNGCTEQLQAINALMPVGVASWFAFSLVGGLAVNTLGPRLTGVCGLVLSLTGWFLLALCEQSFPAYTFAIFLINSGVDVVFIGLMSAADLFPSYRGTVVSTLNAARSLAFGIPFVFNFLLSHGTLTFHSTCFIYAAVLAVWVGLLPIVLPKQVLQQQQHLTSDPSFTHPNKNESPSVKRALGVQFMITTASTEQLSPSSHSEKAVSGLVLREEEKETSTGVGSLLMAPTEEDTQASTTNTATTGPSSDKKRVKSVHAMISVYKGLSERSTRFRMVVEALRSKKFYPLVPMAMLTVLRGGFLSNSAVDQLKSRVHLFALLTPASCIPAPFFGFLGLLQFVLLLMSDKLGSLTAVSILNPLVSSFFLGQFYCYITVTFPSCVSGTLVGLTISVSGLFGLLVTPMYNYSLKNSSFFEMNLVSLSFIVVCYFLIFVLYTNRHN